MKMKLASFFAVCLAFGSASLHAVEQIDRVAVIVDQGVILQSEVERMTQQIKQGAKEREQTLPSESALQTQVIDRLINQSLVLQAAERMGLQLSDAQLQASVARIAEQQGVTIAQLKEMIEAQGSTFEDFRDEVRIEMTVSEARRAMVSRRVYVSPQEISSLTELLKERGRANEEYRLGHILVATPSQATVAEVEATKERAAKVLTLLNSGSEFSKVATAASSGAKALEGGDLGWLGINEMPTLFAEAIEGKSKDELIGPIRSGAGFHILKVVDIRGKEKVEVFEVNARHILIQPSIILSDDKAKVMLEGYLADIKAGKADFAELAKAHSADPGSAARGGELGWADPNIYVGEFKEALLNLDVDQFAGPFKTTHGWHIVQLMEERKLDATDKAIEDQAYGMIFKRKFAEEAEAWLRQTRDEAYIEILD